jgi:branched-chain amino acid transport system permease protein
MKAEHPLRRGFNGKAATAFGIIALAALPLLTAGAAVDVMSGILVYAILAVGLYVQIGLLGLVNFGFSAFFGAGAYVAALLLLKGTPMLAGSLGLTLAAVALLALVVGVLALRAVGNAFIMITLTFSQLLYVLAQADDKWTGGANGLSGVRRTRLPDWLSLDLSTDTGFYYLCLVAFLVTVAFVRLLQGSSLGAVMVGIRENEMRMRVLGYSVQRYKLAGFVISAVLGGVAGFLNATLLGYVGPTSLFWTTSGEAILMVILGGAGQLAGPVVGAALFVALSHYATQITDHWRLIVGVIFIAVVLLAPEGLVPLLRARLRAVFGLRGEPMASDQSSEEAAVKWQ